MDESSNASLPRQLTARSTSDFSTGSASDELMRGWGWKTSYIVTPSSENSHLSSPKRSVSRKRFFRLIDSSSDTEPPCVYYCEDDSPDSAVIGRLLLDDAQVALSARNSIGGGSKAKAVIVVRRSGRPTRKFAFEDTSEASSWVSSMKDTMKRYKTRVQHADALDQFQFEIRNALLQAAEDACEWSDPEDDSTRGGVAPPAPSVLAPAAPPPAPPHDGEDKASNSEDEPDESPVQKRDSTYKSDESESMRRLKMKWQAKLIEQKSDYGKLVYENRQIVKERDELEHNLGNLLAEHEETIDDLELREQEIENLKKTAPTNPPHGLTGAMTLQHFASLIKSGQISFTDPTQTGIEGNQKHHTTLERNIRQELRQASAVVLDSLGSIYREALRAELKTMPNDTGYYDHGDDEDWEHYKPQGDMSKRMTMLATKRDVFHLSSEDEPMQDNHEANDDDPFAYHEHEKRVVRSGTIEVEAISDDEDDILGKVMSVYNHEGKDPHMYTKSQGNDQALDDLATPYEIDDYKEDNSNSSTDEYGNLPERALSERYKSFDKSILLYYFYERHNPTKIYLIPTILEDYHGEEDSLFLSLASKYKHDMKIWDTIADEVDADKEKVAIVKAKLKVLRVQSPPTQSNEKAKSEVQHSGWLEKKNRSGPRKYSKRFFKLLQKDPENKLHGSPILNYYTSEKASKAKGTILLAGCTVAEVSVPPKLGSKAKTSFMFELRHPERGVRLLKTTTQGNLQVWMDKIIESLYQYQKECTEHDRKDPKARQRRRSSLNLASISYKNESDDES